MHTDWPPYTTQTYIQTLEGSLDDRTVLVAAYAYIHAYRPATYIHTNIHTYTHKP